MPWRRSPGPWRCMPVPLPLQTDIGAACTRLRPRPRQSPPNAHPIPCRPVTLFDNVGEGRSGSLTQQGRPGGNLGGFTRSDGGSQNNNYTVLVPGGVAAMLDGRKTGVLVLGGTEGIYRLAP